MRRGTTDRPHTKCARRVLSALTAFAFAATPGALTAQPPPLELTELARGLPQPTAITHAGDDRLFITLQAGQVVIYDGVSVLPTPFLDIHNRVLSGGEQGLLSVAFHPHYRENGFFFVHYTAGNGDSIIARYQRSANDPNLALAGSERLLLRIAQPFVNHNGGQLQFGPDGYLYIGMGDGGSGFDPLCNAQKDDTFLGKMLRIDVDQNVNTPPYYAVPLTNPHRGPGLPLDEIWSEGLRNPWRFSFDRQRGDLYIGDVGQRAIEEVSFQPASSQGGENYGWKVMEGSQCVPALDGCPTLPPCGDPVYKRPILEYGHDQGRCAVTGGYVYRGGRIPALVGHYVYGDYCTGTLWAAKKNGPSWDNFQLQPEVPILTSFGEDQDGELYLVASNTLYRIDGPPLPTSCTPDATTLCLNQGRFQVKASYRTAQGAEGDATAVSLTGDSGYFWFFNDENPELFVKVRNACVNPFQRFWVFVAGLTNVELRITVIDIEAQQVKVYGNVLGRAFQAVQDTQAFATCP